MFSSNLLQSNSLESILEVAKSLFYFSFDGVVITSPDVYNPKILFTNPAMTRLTGYSEQELIDNTPRILQGPKTSSLIKQRLKETLSKGSPFHGSTVNYCKKGLEYFVEWKISPVYDSAGHLLCFISIQRDLSSIKHFFEKLAKSESINFKHALSKILESKSGALTKDKFELNIQENQPLKQMSLKRNIDITELSSILTDCDTNLELALHSNSACSLVNLTTELKDLAYGIFHLEQFQAISDALLRLADSLSQNNFALNERFILESLSALIHDLSKWLNVIFINKTSTNIHQFDDSIISTAKQLIFFIESSTQD